jgi:hypothetical protein
MIESVFAVFSVCALALFRFVPPRRAVALVCMAGWLLLPIGNFPAGSDVAVFPYWLIGIILPSDMLLTKLWLPPLVALAGAFVFDRPSLLRWRARWQDLPVLLWCAWPLGRTVLYGGGEPAPWLSSLYLCAGWGVPWLLGRVYFATPDGARELLGAMVAGLLVIMPIALLEAVAGPVAHGWLYGPHPFRFDGAARYIGYRPIGFFEHGTQYGIWLAATAVAAAWLWTGSRGASRRYWAAGAAVAMALTVLGQSMGAIVLMGAGLALSWVVRHALLRWILPLALVLAIGGAGVLAVHAGSLRSVVQSSAAGRQVIEVVRSTGRGSILWRLAREQEAVAVIREHPVAGAGQWDWWRALKERPWSLASLIAGQFGLVGLVLAMGSLLAPVGAALRRLWRLPVSAQDPAVPLVALVSMAVGDALLNSFFLFPALLAAGALVPPVTAPCRD